MEMERFPGTNISFVGIVKTVAQTTFLCDNAGNQFQEPVDSTTYLYSINSKNRKSLLVPQGNRGNYRGLTVHMSLF